MDVKSLTSQSPGSAAVLASILEDSGVDPKDCYQCGKCSAGCPVASMADRTPREVMRLLQLGQTEAALESNMPWMCAGCNMCVTRCPQDVDMPSVMAAIRREGKRLGMVPVREVDKFQHIFLDNVHMKGVSDEVLLAGRYNMTTGHLFQDALSAPRMMRRGMIGPEGHAVEGKADVRRIMDKVRATEDARWATRMDAAFEAASDAAPDDAATAPAEGEPANAVQAAEAKGGAR